MKIGRRVAYTARGISRIPCQRCGAPSVHQWNVCANDNRFVGICAECDIALNRLVLRWMKFPNWRELLKRYAARVRAIV